jgi:hypothetical protein
VTTGKEKAGSTTGKEEGLKVATGKEQEAGSDYR